ASIACLNVNIIFTHLLLLTARPLLWSQSIAFDCRSPLDLITSFNTFHSIQLNCHCHNDKNTTQIVTVKMTSMSSTSFYYFICCFFLLNTHGAMLRYFLSVRRLLATVSRNKTRSYDISFSA